MPLSLKKYDCISLNTTPLRFIDVVRKQIAEVDVGLANNCVYHGYYNNDKNNMIRDSHFYQNLYMPRLRLRGIGRRYFFWKISAKIRINEPSDQRTFGSTNHRTMNLRNNEPSEQKTFGTAAWHRLIDKLFIISPHPTLSLSFDHQYKSEYNRSTDPEFH